MSLVTPPPSNPTATDKPAAVFQPAIVGLPREALRRLAIALGEPAFRADQLAHWLYVRNAMAIEAMSNLSKSLRQKLQNDYRLFPFELVTCQTSNDGTRKYLFRLDDGSLVESVLMYFEERDSYSVCVSSQVGCAVDCSFCATGKLGFKRHLSPAEIAAQYVYVQGDAGVEVKNVVLMGQGEPLLNADNVLAAMRLLNTECEVGARRITLSTSGIVPQIARLAEEPMQLTLAVSLHAPTNELRDQLVPVNKKWPLEQLIPALHEYVAKTGRRLTIEYILLAGINDSIQHAQQLNELLRGLKCNVNLIPYNPIGEAYGYQRPTREAVLRFMDEVNASGKKTTVRLERGADIAAACGQLANAFSA